MAEPRAAYTNPVPQSIAYLIILNVLYNVLICLGNNCRSAVRAATVLRYIRRPKHSIAVGDWRQIQEYIWAFPYNYHHATIHLPGDGLASRPILLVVDEFRCHWCAYSTQSCDAMKKPEDQRHDLKCIVRKGLFCSVRLQSWFQAWGGAALSGGREQAS